MRLLHPGPQTYLDRGVYWQPFFDVDGNTLAVAITSKAVRIEERVVSSARDFDRVERELMALLDAVDPVPRLELVRDAPQTAPPIMRPGVAKYLRGSLFPRPTGA